MKTLRLKLNNRKGVTLVELIVSVALLAIFCLACSVLIRPCADAFDRMQKTSRAQMIGDTVMEGLRAELMTARGTIRFADAATAAADKNKPFTKPADFNVDEGSALEFRTTGDYFEMIDAGYVPKDANEVETEVKPGQLHMRYFANENGFYKYATVFGYTTAYTEKFYMGNTIELNFKVMGRSNKYINGTQWNCVNSVRVDLTVKDKDGNTVHNQSAILELPNAPVLVQRANQFAPK